MRRRCAAVIDANGGSTKYWWALFYLFYFLLLLNKLFPMVSLCLAYFTVVYIYCFKTLGCYDTYFLNLCIRSTRKSNSRANKNFVCLHFEFLARWLRYPSIVVGINSIISKLRWGGLAHAERECLENVAHFKLLVLHLVLFQIDYIWQILWSRSSSNPPYELQRPIVWQ